MENKLLVPDIGDFEKVEIIEILVKKGDKIKKNDSVVTLESDKSSVEVPSTFEGVIENVNVKIGDKDKKAKKNSVDIKLMPPNSREFASLEHVICNLSLDKDDTLNITYNFKVNKINFQSIDLKAKSSIIQTKFNLEPKDYLIYKTSFNQEKVSQHISEALSEVKKSNTLF